MTLDLTRLQDRAGLIENIASTENVKRKAISLRQTEIYNDNIFDHVWDNVAGRFSPETAKTMPIVSHINIAKRIVKEEASIYREEPKRKFTELSEEQEEKLDLIYRDMMANTKFMRSNEAFKLQEQNHVMIVPKNGKLIMRVLRNHHVDSIPDPDDPEEAIGYIIHSFDRSFFNENRRKDNDQHTYGRFNQFANQENDGDNKKIGDEDDWKSVNARYLVWTKELNFIMNGRGEVISGEDMSSPIPGILPIIDISQEKDFTYWVEQGEAIIDATIDQNVTMTDVGHIAQNQGFAQAYMIASKDMIPNNLEVGPTKLLHMPIDLQTEQRPEFGYAQPGSDIPGILTYADKKLMSFLTSRGLDPDLISTDGSAGVSQSGVHEFLRMMKHFKASKNDYDTYRRAEAKVYVIIKAWYNALINSDKLDSRYKSGRIPEQSELMTSFAGPEMLQTEQEKIDVWASKIENGLASRIDAIQAIEGLSRDAAKDRLKEIDEDEELHGNRQQGRADNEEDQARPFGTDERTEEDS